MQKYFNLFIFSLCFIACSKEKAKDFAVVKVTTEDVANVVSITARAESAGQITIMAPEDITVLALEAGNGQKVTKDQILCKLDPTKVQEMIKKEENRLAQLEAGLKTASIRMEAQKKDVEKSRRLFASGAVSLDEKDKQAQELEIQLAQLSSQENDLIHLKEGLEKLKKEAELMEIKAPFDAIVTYVWTSKDSFIAGSSVKKGDLLFKLSSEGSMIARGTLREQDVGYFHQGQKVKLKFPSLPGKMIEGVVKMVDSSATIDKDTGVASFRILLEFIPTEDIKTGMEVSLDHIVNEKKNVLAIPKTSLAIGKEKPEVVVIESGKKIIKQIETGLYGDISIEVVAGLKAGEEVLVSFEE